MATIPKYRILIVDDNPFPTRECCGILLEKLQNYFGKPFDHTLQEYYCNDYNALQTEYQNISGKSFHFMMEDDVSVSIYNYNPIWPKETNQKNIVKIIKHKKINIFWTDREHSNFRINNEEMFKETNGHPANADDLYHPDTNIVQQLKINGIRQVAMYSFNPEFTYTDIDNKIEEIGKIFQGVLNKDDIYVLETSPILNLFNKDDCLSSGDEENRFLGTLNAYKYYGKLLGSVLFDLFLQIKENKAKLSDKQKRYNFFNRYNRNFLRYFKLLIGDLINKYNDFEIGMVSFYGNIYGQEHFLIDVPYKEYYEKYDTELHKGNPSIGTIIDPIDTDDTLDSKKWLHFKYKKNDNGQFIGCYELEESIKSRGHLVEYYLPLLHTAIFYEPDFYANDFPYNDFKITSKEEFCLDTGNSCIEIIYLFKKVSFEGIQGVSHFVVWRRVQDESKSINLNETIKEIWENYYRLVEAKLEAALVTILQSETAKQAIRAAISQVMARNMSHNIGSHVMNKLIDAVYLEKFCSYGSCLKSYKPLSDFKETIDHTAFKQLAIYNNYVKCRMDYLSDMSFGTPLMQTSKNMFEDVFRPLDKVRLLLENISGLSNFEYNIQFKKDNEPLGETNDFPLAIPNDILGCQALYNIIENVIRNTAKHTEKPKDFLTKFTIRFSDITNEQLAELDETTIQEAQSLICVEIFDNINLANRDNKEVIIGDDKNLDSFAEEIKTNVTDTSYSIPYIDWLRYQQNYKINQSILSENNQLRASSLGLIEMEASAAYLRKIDLNLIDDDEYDVTCNDKLANRYGKLNILKAVKISKDDECYFGYRFFMLKPQEVLIVSDIFKSVVYKSKVEELRNKGIWLITQDDFLKHLLDNNGVYNHQFVIHDNLDNLEIEVNEQAEKVKVLDFFKTSLPIRLIKVQQSALIKLIENESKAILNNCWEKWEVALKDKYKFTDFSYANLPKLNGELAKITDHLKPDPNQTIQDKWVSLKRNSYYVEPCSSKAQNCLPEFSGNLTNYLLNQSFVTKIKNAESILSRILIIDERIQEGYELSPLGINQLEVFNMMRIFGISKSDLNLSQNTIDNVVSGKIVEFINSYVAKVDYVLIHYSILERMFNSEVDRIKAINDYLIKLSKSATVIVTSGRGTPDKLPSDVRFINLSSVILAFNEIRSKYQINYLLNSARKSNRQ